MRLAVWSLGEHARRNLLPAIAHAPGLSLAGVLSRNAATVSKLCDDYQCRTWDNADAMLNDTDVDAVFIAGPNSVHYNQCLATLRAGKHVWCEKSLTPTLDETVELLHLARKHCLVIAEAFMFAYHPQFMALRKLLRDGEIGRIASIRTSFGFPHLATGNIRYSRALAGGALLDAGAYCLAAPLLLLNRDPVFVSGRTVAAPGFEVDTDGAAIMHFPGDAIAIADWGFGRTYRNEIEVWGEQGFVTIRRAFSKPPTLDTAIDVVRENGNRTIELKGGINHFSLMMTTFARAAHDPILREDLATQALRQARAREAIRSQA
jgi:dTDP-3,4-didehydro-2,6-dideoxy-alpha-D-glucose 3-reductase